MYELNFMHFLGIGLTLILITCVGIYSGRKVKNASDFSVGGKKAGTAIVAGTIMGTLVGGASTIGTAELSFTYGFSAWWFTLGGGIGCLFLGLCFVRPLYATNKETVPQILTAEYGRNAGPVSSVCVSVGIFLNIVAQILSAVALLTAMFGMPPAAASIVAIALMAFYVIFGGVWGTGFVGVAKLILLYGAVIIGGTLAVNLGGGVGGFSAAFPREQYFSLFARGFLVDAGAGFSLLLGVLSTQTYIQAVLSGRNVESSRRGALISAILIPPIGLCGIFIGMFMRMQAPDMSPAVVLPQFVITYMHPFVGGIVLATLLIAVVGTGAGLALGISTIFTKDIYKTYVNTSADDKKTLSVSRVLIVAVLMLAFLFTTGNMKSLILKWSFMSMGLRGAAVFVPLCGALFLRGRVSAKFAVAAIILGPAGVLLGKFVLPASVDPLFLGVAVSLIVMGAGLMAGNREKGLSR